MSGQKILVVDDEPMIRWTLTEALRLWGYEPVEAESGAQALKQLTEEHPAAVLLDINLPDSFGLDLLREIKGRRPQTVVIMITAEAHVENAVSALRGGADDFIGKPVNLDELRFALRQHLEEPERGRALRGLPQLLILSDARENLRAFQNLLGRQNVEITTALFPDEWERVPDTRYDFVIVDVGPSRLTALLDAVRTRTQLADAPVLVEITRVAADANLAGVMPRYRAMPCGRPELLSLVRRRLTSMTSRYQVARIL